MNYPATTKKITFSRPITTESGREITEVEMREPLVRDKILFDKHSGTTAEKTLFTVASLCGLGEKDLLTLTSWDYDQLVETMNDFLLLPPAERLEKWTEGGRHSKDAS
ncbi:phage tail assembly protein [Klebsiella aerogenes]|uniref:phage tail assembly protein n=1 Tax=Klebsiella aerogenes TaxID=548 RepID=UPI001F2C0A88|nr:phage tail assembly protein [Klebsiella aerogenes]